MVYHGHEAAHGRVNVLMKVGQSVAENVPLSKITEDDFSGDGHAPIVAETKGFHHKYLVQINGKVGVMFRRHVNKLFPKDALSNGVNIFGKRCRAM
jgi:hypothetical protein